MKTQLLFFALMISGTSSIFSEEDEFDFRSEFEQQEQFDTRSEFEKREQFDKERKVAQYLYHHSQTEKNELDIYEKIVKACNERLIPLDEETKEACDGATMIYALLIQAKVLPVKKQIEAAMAELEQKKTTKQLPTNYQVSVKS